MYRSLFVCLVGFQLATDSMDASRTRRAMYIDIVNCGSDKELTFASSPESCFDWSITKGSGVVLNRTHPVTDRYEGFRNSHGTLVLTIGNAEISDDDSYQHVCGIIGPTLITLHFECKPTSVRKRITPDKHLVLSTDNVYPNPEKITVDVKSSPLPGSFTCTELPSSHYNCTWMSASSLEDIDGGFSVTVFQRDMYSSTTLSGSIKIATPDAPSITNRGQLPDGRWVIHVTENSRINLECVSRGGTPAPTVAWYKDSINTAPLITNRTGLLQKDNVTYTVTLTHSIIAAHPSDDRKTFICRSHYPGATNLLTQGSRETSVLLFLNFKPRQVAVTQTNTPISGENVTLECRASNGRPAPNITWTYSGQFISPHVQSYQDQVTETFSVVSTLERQVNAADNGEPATCHVNSIALTAELTSSININVKFPVRLGSTVILGNKQIEATGTNPLDLNCTTGSSNPASTIIWRKGSTVIPNNNTVHRWTGENRGVVSSQILTLKPTPYDDGDMITCSVTNNDSDVAFSQGGADTDSVHLNLTFLSCPASEFNGLLWKKSYPGRNSGLNACPVGYSGLVTRYCGYDGVYHDPVYNCTNRILIDIADKDDFQKLNEMKKVVVEKNQSTPLYAGDLETINKILRNVTSTIILNSTTWKSTAHDFINIVNSVMEERTTETWTGIINNTGSGVETTIHTLDLFIKNLTVTLEQDEEPIEFAESNLFLRLGNTKNCTSNLEFPDKTRSMAPAWAKSRADSIYIPCDNDLLGQKYSGSMYRDVSKFIPTNVVDNTTRWTLNGPLLGFSFHSNFASNVTVTISFQVHDTSLRNPKCSYWKISNSYTGAGKWSTDGCRLHRYSVKEGIVVCICDHLTNFAVLMSPADSTVIGKGHIKALSIITLVGCIISMLCLALTVTVYIFFWRTLKSDRSWVLINLCLTLFVGYLVFLAGINQTSNEVACTAVSVSLHYIFLVVFCLMLALGIVLGTRVILPFSRKKLVWPFIIAAYVVPVIIEGISMAATKLKGYGNEKCCWLDVNTGLIWAFLAPVLFVILLNAIIIVVVITKMLRTTSMEKKTTIEKTKAAFKGFCVLLPVMGVTWILGIFSVDSETVVFQYLFSIFNSLQGLLIMIFNCILDKKVQMAYRAFKSKIFKSTTYTVTSGTKGVSSGKSTTETGL